MNPTFLWFYSEGLLSQPSWSMVFGQWMLQTNGWWVLGIAGLPGPWWKMYKGWEMYSGMFRRAHVGIICDFPSSQCRYYYRWQSAHHYMGSHEKDNHHSQHKQWQIFLIRKWTGRLRIRWHSLCQLWKENSTNGDNLWQQLLCCL